MMKNLIFDLYGTLIDMETDEESAAFWKKVAALYALYGADYTEEALKEAYRRGIREAEETLGRALSTNDPEIRLEEVFLRLLREAPKKHPVGARVAEASFLEDRETLRSPEDWAKDFSNAFRTFSRRRFCLFPGTLETLTALREKGCRIFLLSNAQRVFTETEFAVLGLAPFFDDVFISSDHGRKKPDPVFLETLLRKHRLKKEDCVMIGNEIGADIGIAEAVGISAVLFNTIPYKKQDLSARLSAETAVIYALPELLSVLFPGEKG